MRGDSLALLIALVVVTAWSGTALALAIIRRESPQIVVYAVTAAALTVFTIFYTTRGVEW